MDWFVKPRNERGAKSNCLMLQWWTGGGVLGRRGRPVTPTVSISGAVSAAAHQHPTAVNTASAGISWRPTALAECAKVTSISTILFPLLSFIIRHLPHEVDGWLHPFRIEIRSIISPIVWNSWNMSVLMKISVMIHDLTNTWVVIDQSFQLN